MAADRADARGQPEPIAPPGVSVIGEIGRGAQSVVYHVRRDGLDYAMKVLLAGAGAGTAARLAFRREAALLASANHPRLATIHDVGEVAGRPYLIMDLIEGMDLAAALRAGPMAAERIVELGIEVAGILAALHRVGLIHRDIKPDNIRLRPDGSARLIDLGMAARGTPESGDLIAGTIAYASPEQGGVLKRPVTPRSDLYSLGVVLYECAVGTVPFVSSEVGELLRMHATSVPADPGARRPDLPPGLVAAISKLLAKDPDDRYADCAALITDLTAVSTAADGQSRTERPAPGPAWRTPLVGRSGELAELVAQWDQARTGDGRLVLLRGPSGIGRSSLLAEFHRTLAAGRTTVLSAHCVDGMTPLAPLTTALDDYLGHLDGARDDRAIASVRAAATVGAPFLRRLSPTLAKVLGADADPTELPADGFLPAMSGFLTALAGESGGAVLIVDDVQWSDGATARVLQQIQADLAGTPILLIIAVTTEDATALAPGFTPDVAPDLDLTLGPLSRDALVALVNGVAGRFSLAAELIERIVARAGDTPAGVLEYVRAVVDAGLVVPRWGTWMLDVDGLDDLDLPGDTVGLLMRRIDNLGPQIRPLLVAAATVGVRFGTRLPAEICDRPQQECVALFDTAVAQGILERRSGHYAFLHDRVRRTLLDATPDDQCRDLHERVATRMRPGDCADEVGYRYAVARHRMSGYPGRHPEAAHTACLDAGRQALDDHAATDAVRLLESARTFGRHQSPAAASVLHEMLGAAYFLDFRFAEAGDALDTALRGAGQPMDRARILEQRARLHLAEWRLDQAWATVRAGLVEAGDPLPANRLWLLITTGWLLIVSILIHHTRIGFGTADPHRAARYRLVGSLYALGAHTSIRATRPDRTLVMDFRARYFANRLGPSVELVEGIAGWACLVQTVTGRRNGRGFRRAARIAADLGNPVAVAAVNGLRWAADGMTCEPNAPELLHWVRHHRPLTQSGNSLDLLDILLTRLLLQGRSAEALAAYQLGATFLTGTDLATHPYGHLGLAVSATLGRPVDARSALRPFDDGGPATTRGGRIFLLQASLFIAAEQREYGETFDRLAAEQAALGINPRTLLPPMRPMYAVLAYGRLEQCRQAAPADRERAVAAAQDALRNLRRSASGGSIGAHLTIHHLVGQAQLRQLRGDHRKALDCLAVADRMFCDHDVPWASFEAERIRARAFTALGRMEDALAQAAGAIARAEKLGWPHRAEWVRAEFRTLLSDQPRRSETSTRSLTSGADRRRLRALEQLSVIASRILDPDELIRVALDETIRILAAERAYLFLRETVADGAGSSAPATGRLVPHLGRSADGKDLTTLTDYGTSIVERVRVTREPIIVTGTDDGAALGSKSMVVHGLRSIMAAPLQFDGRLVGVVYLDSRVAQGMFATTDIGILTALTNHIAVALETARAAQLAVAVQAAEQQRDVADKLRRAMVRISGSLDPTEVLTRLHAALIHLLPGDASCLVRCDENGVTVTRIEEGPFEEAPLVAGTELRRILAADFPVTGTGLDAGISAALGLIEADPGRPWLGVPLRHRGHLVGAVVTTTLAPVAYGPAEINLAAVLATEGMLAYDNAQLFARTEMMATIDVLTEISNRRHFFAVAERDWAQAAGEAGAKSVVMLDIDHFKRINDEHGHQVGDEVIRAIAGRLHQALRIGDRLGRYGGEEFALLLNGEAAETGGVGERLRASIADRAVDTEAGPLAVTVSVGVATFDPGVRTFTQALEVADAALYRAKQSGRNRVVVADQP